MLWTIQKDHNRAGQPRGQVGIGLGGFPGKGATGDDGVEDEGKTPTQAANPPRPRPPGAGFTLRMLPAMRTGALSRTFGLRLLYQPRVQRALVVALLGIFLVIRALQFLNFSNRVDWGFDLSFYWTAAQHVLDGDSVYAPFQLAGPYPPQGVAYEYLYPPFLAVAIAPLVAVVPNYQDANWLWAGMGAVILVLVVLLVARRERLGSIGDRVLLVGAAFVMGPIISELILGNVHLLILGLLGGAWLLLQRGARVGDVGAGAMVGAAAMVKVFPGLLIVWLLLTRRYRAAIATAATMAALFLLTLPVVGLEPWLQYPTVLANLGAPTELTFVLAPSAWLSSILPARIAQVVVVIAGLAVVAWATRRRSEPISYAVAVTASVLIAPALYPHYLTILVLPLLLALRHVQARGWVALAYVLMFGLEIDALGDARQFVNRVMLTLGPLLLVAVLTWFGRERGARSVDVASP